jgi:hypothetical protein
MRLVRPLLATLERSVSIYLKVGSASSRIKLRSLADEPRVFLCLFSTAGSFIHSRDV